MRCAPLLLLLAGCSSSTTAPSDLSVPPSDLAVFPCSFVFQGDAAATFGCNPVTPMLCRPTAFDSLQILSRSDTPYARAELEINGRFTPGMSYAGADLKSVNFDAGLGGVEYGAGAPLSGWTVALTITNIVDPPPPGMDPCGGSAHGSAHVAMVEKLTNDGGMTSTGARRVTLDLTF